MAGGTPHWSHTAGLEAAPRSASVARAFVSRHLVAHRLAHLDDRVLLAVSELATNAVAHARTAFSVSLSADDHAVLLTVRDDSAALPTLRAAQIMDAGGRGLALVAMVSTDWGVTEDGAGSKDVWASFAIS